jgi:RNA polymerase sigma factor (sigma-70 family)
MPSGARGPLLRYLRQITGADRGGEAGDAHLLARFAVQRDGDAFAALVRRHGPMVLGVCRRVLHDPHEAEDAFQATFLLLVRKAAAIGKPELLANWLYGVAYRTSLKARAEAVRRRARQRKFFDLAAAEPAAESVWQELRPYLDAEVQRLPEKYRVPVVLCYLEGKTHQEAAHLLGCPRETVSTRLARARERLRRGLTRRGLALPAGLLATVLSRPATAAVPPLLAGSTGQAALAALAGEGIISARAAALAEGVQKAMFLTNLKIVAAVLLLVGAAGYGAGLLTFPLLASEGKDGQPSRPAAKGADPPRNLAKYEAPSLSDGVVLVIGTDIKKGEKVPAAQIVTAKVGGEVRQYRRLKKGDTVEEGQLLAVLDDRLARTELAIREVKLSAAKAELRSAQALLRIYQEEVRRFDKIIRDGGRKVVQEQEYAVAKAQRDKYANEADTKQEGVKLAQLEVQKAQLGLERFEIRSRVRGVIQAVYKQPGEAVKALEPVFQIYYTEP